MKKVSLLALSITMLFSQKISDVARSENIFLGTDITENNEVYIDESSLLAWQNSRSIIRLNGIENAKNYCAGLNLSGYSWRLPTVTELLSLSSKRLKPSMNAAIAYGRSKTYLASDKPVWDNKSHYGFDYAQRAMLVFETNTRSLYVRCVSSLE